jgi:PAS domain S-box-containing protein
MPEPSTVPSPHSRRVPSVATDAVIGASRAGTIVFWGAAARRTFGFSSAETLGQPLATVLDDIPLRAGRAYRTTGSRRDATRFEAEVDVESWSWQGEELLSIAVRDLARGDLFDDMLDVLSAASALEEVAPLLLERIATGIHAQAGALWTIDGSRSLRLRGSWPASDAIREPDSLSLRVWSSGQIEWTTADSHLSIAIPTSSAGVLQLFSRDADPPDAQTLALLTRVGTQIGMFIECARADAQARALFDNSLIATARIDGRGRLTDVNGAFASTFRFATTGDATGVRFADLLADEAQWPALLVSGREAREVLGRRRDGKPFFMLLSIVPLTDDSLLATAVDIADRKQSEIELHELIRTLDEAHEVARTGIFEQREDGFVRSSDELYRIFGVEARSRPLTLRFGIRHTVPEDRDRLRGAIELAIRGRNALDLKLRIRRDDGEQRVVRVHAKLTTQGGRLQRVAGKVVDITDEERAVADRVELQRQLSESKRLSSLGQLAATMAHEFNNVLMGIETFAEVLRRRTMSEPHAQTAVLRIQQSLARGRRITDEILRFTREQPPLVATIDVRRWLEDFLPEASALTSGRARVVVSEDLFIRGDVSQLNQVLANLVINARDASPEGPIVIEARRETSVEECLDLIVCDRGPGIPESIRDRIFEPLFTTKRSGTGLGLAVVHQVVMAHGATIDVKSEIGSGTEFHLHFPLVAEARTEIAGAAMRVLLVEDDPSVALALSALLEIEGIDLRVTARGDEGIREVARERPDVVLLDTGLPDMSGLDVYDQIATRWPTLPVIFISAKIDDARVAKLLVRPHIGFLPKPFEGEQLLNALVRVASARRLHSGHVPNRGQVTD